jgi:hypothetical protein
VTEPSGLKRYDYYQGPQALGDLWTATRAGLTLRCACATHRLGWELRLGVGKNVSRTQVCRSETEVFSVSDEWEAEAGRQGWTVAGKPSGA